MFQDWASLTSNETIKEENHIMNKQCKCIFHNDRVLTSILEFFNILEKKKENAQKLYSLILTPTNVSSFQNPSGNPKLSKFNVFSYFIGSIKNAGW